MTARFYAIALFLLTVGCSATGVLFVSAPAHATGDKQRGQEVYERCMGCHAIGREVVGPDHAGLFARQPGTLSGYDYSPAMRAFGQRLGHVWDEAALDRFITNPRSVVPGTKMGFAGIPDAEERADLIAYLKEATRR
jgi:cytochrome c